MFQIYNDFIPFAQINILKQNAIYKGLTELDHSQCTPVVIMMLIDARLYHILN